MKSPIVRIPAGGSYDTYPVQIYGSYNNVIVFNRGLSMLCLYCGEELQTTQTDSAQRLTFVSTHGICKHPSNRPNSFPSNRPNRHPNAKRASNK